MATKTTEKLSTSALAKRRGMAVKVLFSELAVKGWIVRLGEQWELTSEGRKQGGEVVASDRFGQYIVWPDDIDFEGNHTDALSPAKSHLSVSQIVEKLPISAALLNRLLAELGWIKKAPTKGWELTPQGAFFGGLSRKTKDNIGYVIWPDNITEQSLLKHSIGVVQGELSAALNIDMAARNSVPEAVQRYKNQPANLCSLDGHTHKQSMNLRVDNWLYLAGIIHATNRALPFDTSLTADFYLPAMGVYIECLHSTNDASYLTYVNHKRQQYKQAGLELIELNDADTRQLDINMHRILQPFGFELT